MFRIRIRRFKLKPRVKSLFKFIHSRIRKRSSSQYHRIKEPITTKERNKTLSKLFSCLKSRASFLHRASDRGYKQRLLEDQKNTEAVPKGKMAVYVGSEDNGDFQRYLLPVIYFNHPLFGELLREVEEEFGFDHQGGIMIPCHIKEFENVRTRIAANFGSRRMITWKRRARG